MDKSSHNRTQNLKSYYSIRLSSFRVPTSKFKLHEHKLLCAENLLIYGHQLMFEQWFCCVFIPQLPRLCNAMNHFSCSSFFVLFEKNFFFRFSFEGEWNAKHRNKFRNCVVYWVSSSSLSFVEVVYIVLIKLLFSIVGAEKFATKINSII